MKTIELGGGRWPLILPHALTLCGPQQVVIASRWCCPSHLRDATTVTKPETWESSLAFLSVTHTHPVGHHVWQSLFLIPSQNCPLICTCPVSGHIISHQNDWKASRPVFLLQPHPTHLIFHIAARRRGLFHKSCQGIPALV